jgi:hypothetical protein
MEGSFAYAEFPSSANTVDWPSSMSYGLLPL